MDVKASYGIAILDDDSRRRDSLAAAVIAERLAVVVSAGQDLQAIQDAIEKRPAIAFVGLGHPPSRGLRTMATLSPLLEGTAIVALSSDVSTRMFQSTIRAGGLALLRSPIDGSEVRAALRAFDHSAHPRRPSSTSQTGRIVTVAGQKGGIGKTTVAVNVAASLAWDSAVSVLIVDLDMAFGDVALALNLSRPPTYPQRLEMLWASPESLKESLLEHGCGARVLRLSSDDLSRVEIGADDLETLLSLAAGIFDFVIVDTPGTYNEAVVTALSISDHALILSSLEVASGKNTGRLVRMLDESGYPPEQILVVVNNTVSEPGLSAGDLAAALHLGAVWEIPFAKGMPAATLAGKPLVLGQPTSTTSKSLRALASRIAADAGKLDRRSAVRVGRRASPADLRLRLTTALKAADLSLAS